MEISKMADLNSTSMALNANKLNISIKTQRLSDYTKKQDPTIWYLPEIQSNMLNLKIQIG